MTSNPSTPIKCASPAPPLPTMPYRIDNNSLVGAILAKEAENISERVRDQQEWKSIVHDRLHLTWIPVQNLEDQVARLMLTCPDDGSTTFAAIMKCTAINTNNDNKLPQLLYSVEFTFSFSLNARLSKACKSGFLDHLKRIHYNLFNFIFFPDLTVSSIVHSDPQIAMKKAKNTIVSLIKYEAKQVIASKREGIKLSKEELKTEQDNRIYNSVMIAATNINNQGLDDY